MANRFSQIFTLTDIFNNERLKDKLPLVDYKKEEEKKGKNTAQKNTETVNNEIFETSISAAKPFYKSIAVSRGGNKLIISGDLVGDQDDTVDAVYNALMAKKQILIWAASNADIITSALKEAENNKRKYGINSKLYLRVQSMQQIQGMSKHEINGLLENVMENILYGDDFPETQKKFNVEKMAVNSRYDYKQRKMRWKFKVGDV